MNTVEIKINSNGLNDQQAKNLAAFLTSLGQAATEVEKAAEDLKVENPVDVSSEFAKLEVVEIKTPKKRTKKEATAILTNPKDEEATEPEATEPEATEPEATAAETTAVETTAVETTAAEATAAEATEPEKGPNLIQIRSLVAAKQVKHREFIKSKLNAFGSANVTNLSPSHYQEFYDLLMALE